MRVIRMATGEERAGCLPTLLAVTGVVLITLALADVALLVAGAFLLAVALLAHERRRRRRAHRARQRTQRAPSRRLPRTWWHPVAMSRQALDSYLGSLQLLEAGPTRARLEAGLEALHQEAQECAVLASRGADLDRQLGRLTRRRRVSAPATALDLEARALRQQVDRAHAEVVRSAETMQRIALCAGQVVLASTLSERDRLLSGIEDLARDLTAVAEAVDEVQALAAQPPPAPRPQPPPAARPQPPDAPLQRAEG